MSEERVVKLDLFDGRNSVIFPKAAGNWSLAVKNRPGAFLVRDRDGKIYLYPTSNIKEVEMTGFRLDEFSHE